MTQDICSRIADIESANRRLKLGLAACFCAIIALGAVAAVEKPGPVSASAFRLVDDVGKLRAELGYDDQGTFFFLSDETGKLRATKAAQKSAAFISFKDEQGRSRVSVVYDQAGGALRIKDASGATTALFIDDARGPAIQLRDAGGDTRIIDPMADVLERKK